MRNLLLGLATIVALALTRSATPAAAQAVNVQQITFCSYTYSGLLNAGLSWNSTRSDVQAVWLNVSAGDPTWQPESSVAIPLAANANQYEMLGLWPDTTYYLRIDEQVSGGWESTPVLALQTGDCSWTIGLGASGPASSQGGYSSNSGSNLSPNISGPFIPYAGNGLGPTQCADGTVSHSAGRGTCSGHGGEAH